MGGCIALSFVAGRSCRGEAQQHAVFGSVSERAGDGGPRRGGCCQVDWKNNSYIRHIELNVFVVLNPVANVQPPVSNALPLVSNHQLKVGHTLAHVVVYHLQVVDCQHQQFVIFSMRSTSPSPGK